MSDGVFIIVTLVVICNYYNIILPFFIGSALIAFPYFYLGLWLGTTKFLYPNKYDKYIWSLSVIFIGVSYLIYFYLEGGAISIIDRSWSGFLILAYINSAFIVLGVLLICKILKWIPIISYVGRYSIITLGIHMFILTFLAVVVERLIGISLNQTQTLIFTLLLCWFMIPVMRKYFPYVTAQKDLIR